MAPMITIEERALRHAVSPFLCEELLILGIDATLCQYQYLIGDHQIFLRNYQWDHAGIYRETDEGFFEACGHKIRKTLGAFTGSDMEALLPPYMMVKDGMQDYKVSLDSWYDNIDIAQDRRAPDALARMVIDLLKKNVLKPAQCNQILM
jgi:hypothetical protein